jgi:hypothetical protein
MGGGSVLLMILPLQFTLSMLSASSVEPVLLQGHLHYIGSLLLDVSKHNFTAPFYGYLKPSAKNSVGGASFTFPITLFSYS